MSTEQATNDPVRIEQLLLPVARAAAALADAMAAMTQAPIEYTANDPFVLICVAARAACLQILQFEGGGPVDAEIARRLYQERDLAESLPPLFVEYD